MLGRLRAVADEGMRGKRFGMKRGDDVHVSPAVYSLLETDYIETAKSLGIAETSAGRMTWLRRPR